MPATVIVGTGLALLVGLVMGLIGAGGSILTMPILVYIVGIDVIPATSYALLVVGTAAVAGATHYWRRGLVDGVAAVRFAVPSLVAVFAVRRFVIPALPDVLLEWGGLWLTSDIALLLVFAAVMTLSAVGMIRRPLPVVTAPGPAPAPATVPANRAAGRSDTPRRWWRPVAEGTVVGAVTGLVGAGGGFAIVPALVVWGGLSMQSAVGTSLTIIAAKSLVGFIGDLGTAIEFDWVLLGAFVALALVGVVAGARMANRIPANALRLAFAWFVLVAAALIVATEVVTGIVDGARVAFSASTVG